MKLKTINSVICRKFDAWLESIKDQRIKKANGEVDRVDEAYLMELVDKLF